VSNTQPVVVSAEVTGTDAAIQLQVPSDLRWFEGHFPEAPILPGVVQLDWVIRLAERYLELPDGFAGMEVIKFQRVIRPGMRIELNLEHNVERGKLSFRISSSDGDHAKGRILTR
jgi:3-hydroxymyristoyl/3-hydroxydecanoyl-(acyl carrier protein) dehydratase